MQWHCNTDISDCCGHSDNPNGVAQGHWYYPNGDEVRSHSVEHLLFRDNGGYFFYRNRDHGVVCLYLRSRQSIRKREISL